jgi:hypothetical protein
MMMRLFFLLFVSLVVCSAPAAAQSIGYAGAIDRLAVGCGKDIDRYCKSVNLGGGRVMQCLAQNQGKISPTCRTTIGEVGVLLQRRVDARANVMRICDIDLRRLCAGIVEGDGNLLSCFMKVEQNASAACRQAVTDAGYR